MSTNCDYCGKEVPSASRICVRCARDTGFPNVRYSSRDVEVSALNARVNKARAIAAANGSRDQLDEFEQTVSSVSSAVMNRDLGSLHAWLSEANPMFLTYHQQVRSGARFPRDSEWDEQRNSADNTICPNFYSELSYAALSLDDSGLAYYGPFCAILREEFIAHRATAFEENGVYFLKRHKVVSGDPAPKGYRAPWAKRGLLAIAKLHTKISAQTIKEEFSSILMDARRAHPDCDFIEIHIYDKLNFECIRHVVGPVPKLAADQALWESMKQKLSEQGITWNEL